MMGDSKNRARIVLLQWSKKRHHLAAQAGTERGERFVKQKHRPVLQKHPCKRRPLALAAGKLMRQSLLLAGQADAPIASMISGPFIVAEHQPLGAMPKPTLV